MQRRLLLALLVLFLCILARPALILADTTQDLNLPGIGNLIAVESSSINPTDLMVTRQLDSFSPLLFDATVTGELFATGSLDTFDTSFSTTNPITSFMMTDIQITSIQHSGSFENPLETVTLSFATGTLVSNFPEPSSLLLLGSGLLGTAGIRRRRIGC